MFIKFSLLFFNLLPMEILRFLNGRTFFMFLLLAVGAVYFVNRFRNDKKFKRK